MMGLLVLDKTKKKGKRKKLIGEFLNFWRGCANKSKCKSENLNCDGKIIGWKYINERLVIIHTMIFESEISFIGIYRLERRVCLEWFHDHWDWIATVRNKVVFSEESRFNLGNDDNHACLWRYRGENVNPAFVLQRHTAVTAAQCGI